CHGPSDQPLQGRRLGRQEGPDPLTARAQAVSGGEEPVGLAVGRHRASCVIEQEHAARKAVEHLPDLVPSGLGEAELLMEAQGTREMWYQALEERDLLWAERRGRPGPDHTHHAQGILPPEQHRAEDVEVSLWSQEVVVKLGTHQNVVRYEGIADRDAAGG